MPSRKNRDDDDRLAGGEVHPGQHAPGAAPSNAEAMDPGPGLVERPPRGAHHADAVTPDAKGTKGTQGRSSDAQVQPRDGQERPRSDVPPAWLRTSAVVLGSALLLVLLLVIAAATLPTWWAQTVGRQVDGVPAAGTLWGLFYGVTFTLIPLLLAVVALRVRWAWKVRVGIGVAAVLLLLPNLLTLAVAIGASERTRSARTLMIVQAPNFRLATLIGAVATLVVGTALALLLHRMTASRRELAALRKQARPD